MSVIRSTIEATNRTLAVIKAGRQVSLSDSGEIVKVNLGCGLAVTKGWINVDGSLNALVAGMPSIVHRMVYRLTGAKHYYSQDEYCRLLADHRFVHHDLASGLPFKTGVVQYIYSSHFLEHLYKADAIRLLEECHRALKPGGVIRISIPDLEYALNLYQLGRKEEMLANYFFVEDGENHFSRHKYMYDFPMLKTVLEQVGFKDVVRCQFQSGQVPDIEILDNRAEESLFVEACK